MRAPAAKGGGKGHGPSKRAAGSGRRKRAPAKKHHYSKAQNASFKKWVKTHPLKKSRSTGRRRTLTLNGINEGHEVSEEILFGRNKPYTREEKPRLILEHYLDHTEMPKPPATVDRASKVASWPMYLNDRLGDCTCAAVGHVIQAWTEYANIETTIPDNAVLTAYEAVSGYNPNTGANDNGAVEQDVLNYWRKTGVGGHKIAGFAQLASLDNLVLAKQALDTFGTLYLGIQVPASAMDQFQAGEPWDYVPGSPIEGGHAVPVQFWTTDRYGEIEVVTWGQRQRMTRKFWYEYVEECWVPFSADWLRPDGKTIDGLDKATLRQDFETLTGQPADF